MKTDVNNAPKTPNNRNKDNPNKIINKNSLSLEKKDNFNNVLRTEYNDCQKNSSLLLENIFSYLEKLALTFKDDKKLLFNILKEIYNTINLLIKEFITYSNKGISINDGDNDLFLTENLFNESNNNEEENNIYNFDSNSKVVFLLKIKTLSMKIYNLNEELKSLKQILNNSFDKLSQNKNDNIYKYFMKKIKEMKIMKKCDEFKYLLYIENQKKKIMELEQQLKLNQNENLSKDILKNIRCFPNMTQYNFKEDINPKSIPLYQYLHNDKDKKIKSEPKSKKNIKTSISFKNKNKKAIHYVNSEDKRAGRQLYKTKELILSNVLKTDMSTKSNHMINIKDIKKNIIIFRNRNNINSFDFLNDSAILKTEYQTLNPGEKILVEKYMKKYLRNKNTEKEVKKFKPKTMINNKKEFFLAHPTLNYAGVSKGKDHAYSGLPKKLLKLNRGGNFKSARMIFPSSLNETMVNLEKLRINKFHINENKKD